MEKLAVMFLEILAGKLLEQLEKKLEALASVVRKIL
jgi:hypothetical protein